MALEKATITNTVTNERVLVTFNPAEYTVSQSVTYAASSVPGSSAPILQFVAGELKTLEMELMLDSYEEHREGSIVLNRAGEDVRNLTGKLTSLMDIDPTTHAPPVALFVWGSLSFVCVLARASQRFVMFLSNGVPVRAHMQVTFNEFTNAEMEAKQVKRETADYSKTWVVSAGDTLSSIGFAEYGDARMWRPIALRNGIDRPRELVVGSSLILPRLPYRDPDSGQEYPS